MGDCIGADCLISDVVCSDLRICAGRVEGVAIGRELDVRNGHEESGIL